MFLLQSLMMTNPAGAVALAKMAVKQVRPIVLCRRLLITRVLLTRAGGCWSRASGRCVPLSAAGGVALAQDCLQPGCLAGCLHQPARQGWLSSWCVLGCRALPVPCLARWPQEQ